MKIKKRINQYKAIVLYLFFGICTTGVKCDCLLDLCTFYKFKHYD